MITNNYDKDGVGTPVLVRRGQYISYATSSKDANSIFILESSISQTGWNTVLTEKRGARTKIHHTKKDMWYRWRVKSIGKSATALKVNHE